MTALERMARAMYGALVKKPSDMTDYRFWSHFEDQQPAYLASMRAALLAIREPTEQVIAEMDVSLAHLIVSDRLLEEAWKAGIDSILSETAGASPQVIA